MKNIMMLILIGLICIGCFTEETIVNVEKTKSMESSSIFTAKYRYGFNNSSYRSQISVDNFCLYNGEKQEEIRVVIGQYNTEENEFTINFDTMITGADSVVTKIEEGVKDIIVFDKNNNIIMKSFGFYFERNKGYDILINNYIRIYDNYGLNF